MIGFLMLTAGGLLSIADPVRKHLAWMRWKTELRRAFPIVSPSPALDELMARAAEALDRVS